MGNALSILVFGDSFVNFKRFDKGIETAFELRGMHAKVTSVSMPGYVSAKLLKTIKKDCQLKVIFSQNGPFDIALIIAGVNDIVLRRGANSYASSMVELVREFESKSSSTYYMQIVPFNENADISDLKGRLKHKFFQYFRDPGGNRIARYRKAADSLLPDKCIEVESTLPQYRDNLFKDGIHLTDMEFQRLSMHVGKVMAEKYGSSEELVG